MTPIEDYEVDTLRLSGPQVVQPRKATDEEIAAWVERHDLGSLKGNDARCAFEDAESHHLTRGMETCDHIWTSCNSGIYVCDRCGDQKMSGGQR